MTTFLKSVKEFQKSSVLLMISWKSVIKNGKRAWTGRINGDKNCTGSKWTDVEADVLYLKFLIKNLLSNNLKFIKI
jgi:endo-beta-N-acetylglucosaminidase D